MAGVGVILRGVEQPSSKSLANVVRIGVDLSGERMPALLIFDDVVSREPGDPAERAARRDAVRAWFEDAERRRLAP